MKNSKLQIPSWIQRAERGEDASFEFVTWVPILMFLVLTIAFVGIYWSSRIPARQAATECVRMAIATLDENIGIPQGIQAGYDSLKKDDTRKNIGFVSNVNVGFDPGYVWARGKPLTCRVQYRIKFDNG